MKKILAFNGRKFGFSIVELMIVVTIIGILATIIGIGYDRAKKRQRDAKRIADINIIAQALYTYKEKINSFPLSDTAPLSTRRCTINYTAYGNIYWEKGFSTNSNFINGLKTNKDIESVPKESMAFDDIDYKAIRGSSLQCSYRYLYNANNPFISTCGANQNYAVLYTQLEIQRKVEVEDQRPVCVKETESNVYGRLYEGVAPNRTYTTSGGGSEDGPTTKSLGHGFAKYLPD
jgi:prepilin-type N-terminal cleavage/methylation domain-containing protein